MTEETQVTETVTETETEGVETPEVKQAKEPKPSKRVPHIRDTEEYVLELRKENEKLRKSHEKVATERAEELANKKLEQLRAEVEEKARLNAEKLIADKFAEMAAKEEQQAAAHREALIKSELRAQAQRAGVVDFADLYQIMQNKELKDVEVNDEGEIVNAAAIIAEVKAKKPHLFAGVTTASTTRVPPTNSVAPPKPALSMSREEYEKARREVTRRGL